MTDRSKIIEVMASGICGPGTPCEACRTSAVRALSGLHAEGLAVVPVVPSAEMLHAGSASYDYPSVYMGGPSEGGKRLSARIYRAMLKAAASPYGKAVVKEKDDE